MFSSRASRWEGREAITAEQGHQQHQTLFPVAAFRITSCFFAQNRFAPFGNNASALRQAQHVQDQGHLAVAHDGGAGKKRDPFQLLAQRFDHDFFGVVDLVDDQAKLPVIRLQAPQC